MPAPAKFAGLADPHDDAAELSVATLREQADKITLWLERNAIYAGKWLKPMQRRKLEAQLDATCTCIELLTIDGNYSAERSESLVRVRTGLKP